MSNQNTEKPQTIYLQIANASDAVKLVGDYTWSQHRIYESDLEYTLVEPQQEKGK